MPSVLGESLNSHAMTIPSATSSFHVGSGSHRLKQLEKWNRLQSCTKHKQSACRIMGDTTAIGTFQKDSFGASNTRNDDSMTELDDNALEEILHIQEDVQEGAQNHVLASQATLICLQKVEMCPVLNMLQGSDCSTKTHGGLTKSATFPSSGKTLPSPLGGRSEALDTAADGLSSLKYENPSYTRSMSMPTPLRLASAMKGGCEQLGKPRLVKMNVTWTPDGYDPPTNSFSHTVRRPQYQRPIPKNLKDQKQKRRGKSARGSSNEKKHQGNRSNGRNDHVQLRTTTFSDRTLPLDGFDQPAGITSNVASSNRSVLLDGFDEQNDVDVRFKCKCRGIIGWEEGFKVW